LMKRFARETGRAEPRRNNESGLSWHPDSLG
jgi:hypothetical protein